MTASKDAQEDLLVHFLYHILIFPESWVKRESVLKNLFSSCFEQHFVQCISCKLRSCDLLYPVGLADTPSRNLPSMLPT
jgi:hypothetical protein